MYKKASLTLSVVLFQIVFLVGGGFAAPAEEAFLSSAELNSLVFNTTAEVKFEKTKSDGLIYFSPNGELKMIKNSVLYKGKWKVRKNDRLCIKVEEQSWDCRAVVKNKDRYDQYIVKKNGKHKREIRYRNFHQGRKLKELQRGPLLPQGTLTADQAHKLFNDKTVESVTASKGRVSHSYYGSDGTVEQVRDGQMRFGKWRVSKNGRICLQMENLQEKCRIIVKEGTLYKKYIVKKNGQHKHSVSYRKFKKGRQL